MKVEQKKREDKRDLEEEARRYIAGLGGAAFASNAAALPKVMHKGHLVFGDVEIPCAVIEGKIRVLSANGLAGIFLAGKPNQRMLAKKEVISVGNEDAELPYFMARKAIIPFISRYLTSTPILSPIRYRNGRKHEYGYRAELLTLICKAWTDAKNEGALKKTLVPAGEVAKSILYALSDVGVVSLVDEATGYQFFRDRNDLQKLLEKYLSGERLAWAKMFPDEFYKHIYRLKGWEWGKSNKRTPLIGKITNKIVYEKLPDGVLETLRHLNPPASLAKNRLHCHHQFLSTDVGQKDLTKHLNKVITVMELSTEWDDFEQKFKVVFP